MTVGWTPDYVYPVNIVANGVLPVGLAAAAITLLALDRSDARARTMAAYLLAGAAVASLAWGSRYQGALPEPAGLPATVAALAMAATVPLIAYFFVLSNWPRADPVVRVARVVTILFAAVVVYFLLGSESYGGPLAFFWPAPFGPAPLFLWIPYYLLPAILASMGLWFAVVASRAPPASARTFHRILALGFVTPALVHGGFWLKAQVDGRFRYLTPGAFDSGLAESMTILQLLALPIATFGWVWLVVSCTRGCPRAAPGVWIFLVGFVALSLGVWPTGGDQLVVAMLGVFAAVGQSGLAVFAGYALLRRSDRVRNPLVFDRWVRYVVQGTLVAVAFAAAAYVPAAATAVVAGPEVSQEGPHWVPRAGLIGLGVMVLAAWPLHWSTRWLALNLVPWTRPLADVTREERAALYAYQAGWARLDGAVGAARRVQLDTLARTIALDPDEAARVEVMAGLPAASPPDEASPAARQLDTS